MRRILSLLYTLIFIICIYPHPANSVDGTQLIYNCPLCSDSLQSCGLTGIPPSCSLTIENGEYESCCTESNGNCTHKCELKCNQGYYKLLDISCAICPAGSYCPSGATQTTKCPTGKYSNKGALICTDCPAPYTTGLPGTGVTINGCSVILTPGQYVSNGKVTTCPAGYYCSGGITYYDNNGATQCPENHYCSEGSTEPSSCPPQKPLSPAGSTRVIQCFQCANGLYYDEATKECTTCPMGYYCTGGKKTACPAGQYNNKTGQSECTLCPGGTFNDKTGQTKCTECPDINTHKATEDKYPAGWYASEGNININSVSNPKWDSLAGKTAETECVGNYNVSGPRGEFTHEAVRYNSDSKQYDNFKVANLYYRYPNAGYYLRTKYSDTYCDNPEHQMIYREALPCPAGRFCEGQDKAILCKEGTYGDTLGISGNIAAGYFSNGGATSAQPNSTTPDNGGTGCVQSTECPDGGCFCGYVAPGHYSTGGGTLFSPSGPGEGCLDGYKCGAVDAGYYSTGGGTGVKGTCLNGHSCGTLAGGHYATCGAKKKNPTVPQSGTNPDCTTDCECGYTEEGYYSSGGGTQYKPKATGDGCLDGFQFQCGPCNREKNEICPRGSSSKQACEAGKYCQISSTDDTKLIKNNCPVGTTSNAGATAITNCFINSNTNFCVTNEKRTKIDNCFNLPAGTTINLTPVN